MNLTKKVYNWFTKDMPPIDKDKIDAIVKSLGVDWEEADGFFSSPSVKWDGTTPNVDLGTVLIQKVFVNKTTGEIRYFWWGQVKK